MTTAILIPILLLCIAVAAVEIGSVAASTKNERDIKELRQLLRHHGIEGD